MRIDLEIEYERQEMEALLLADVQQKYPAPAGHEYRVKHIFMDRATVYLLPVEVAAAEETVSVGPPEEVPAVDIQF